MKKELLQQALDAAQRETVPPMAPEGITAWWFAKGWHAAIAQPEQPTLTMRPMESEDGIKGWYIDGPDFYCDIDRAPGEQYSIFIRHKDGTEGFAELAQPEQPAAPVAPIPALPTPWHHRILKVHPKSEPEFWPDELRIKYMADEISELRAAVTLQVTPPVAQAEPTELSHQQITDKLHLYEEIAEHYAECNISPEALRDWVADRIDKPSKVADSRDAARYRWLRDESNWSDDGICPMVASCEDTLYGEALDKAVDAAIKAKDATP